MSEETGGLGELRVDAKNLYREEIFTDLKVGTIRRLTPVTADGGPDLGRKMLYLGQTHVMSRAGPLPVECEIDATSLEDAIQKFPAAVQRAVEEMIAEARELQRQQASSLVIPGAGPKGRIQMP